MILRFVSPLLLLIIPLSTFAQEQIVDFRVTVSFQNGLTSNSESNSNNGTAGPDAKNQTSTAGQGGSMNNMTAMQIRVQVIDPEGGGALAESSPNSEGVAQFRLLGSNTINGKRIFPSYRVRVFGSEIEEQWAEGVEPGRGDRMLNMVVRRKGEKPLGKSDKGIISASGLRIPPKADKELEKGNKALADNKLDLAKEHIDKAIELYPQFDQAYNMLGVVLLKTGDAAGGKKAFEKAVQLNDKFARAYVNLAKLSMQDKQYDQALTLIGKSLSVEPMNPEAISIACQASLIVEKYEDVAADSRKLHGLPHDGMALCHFAAGVALTNLKRSTDAITEYNLYLSEAKPNDLLVPKARDALEELNKQAAAK
jgi:tetratricopeptide (TPR) repeat protein